MSDFVVPAFLLLFRPQFLLLIACALLASACDRAESRKGAASAPNGDGATETRGCVWLVDKPGQAGRLYFCGTIHILREQDYPLAAGYEAAYADSDKLVLELPPEANPGGDLSRLGVYNDGGSLSQNVSPETWAEVKKWAAKRNVAVKFVEGMRPWFASLVITATEYAALGAKADKGVDRYFEQKAKKDGKPGEGLETVELQIQLFAGLKKELQEELLMQTMKELRTLGEQYEKMISAWKIGNLEELQELLFEEAERYPELMALFITNRNRSWLGKLQAMLEKGDKAMVLVGAGHLSGKEGVLELLKARGYQVRHYLETKGE